MEYCEDCGIRLDRHGEDCGFESGDTRAPSYGRPAGWLDGAGNFALLDAALPDPHCALSHDPVRVTLDHVRQLEDRRHVWVYRCASCGREGVAVTGFPVARFRWLVPAEEDDTQWPGRRLTEVEAAAAGDVLAR